MSDKIDEKSVEEFLFSSGTKLSQQQKQLFIQMAVRCGLDPFKREIYAIPYGNNFSIVTGYQTYIERAEMSGKLDGWEVNATPETAIVVIYRKDWTHPFKWEIAKSDFDKGTGSWIKMPSFMLKKVAISQAFRLCFPDVLGGLPYTADELEGAEPFCGKTEKAKPEPAPKEAKPGESKKHELPEKVSETVKLFDGVAMATKEQLNEVKALRQQLRLDVPAVMGLIGKTEADAKNLTHTDADGIINELNKILEERVEKHLKKEAK